MKFDRLQKDFVVVVERSCFYTNLPDLDDSLRNYGQEEADTGIVLHAIEVCKRDPCSEIIINCSDTDFLLILLHYFQQLPSTTMFKKRDHQYTYFLLYFGRDSFLHQYNLQKNL